MRAMTWFCVSVNVAAWGRRHQMHIYIFCVYCWQGKTNPLDVWMGVIFLKHPVSSWWSGARAEERHTWHSWRLPSVFIAVYFPIYCLDFSFFFFFFLPSDSVMPCFILTGWERWILSCPSLVASTCEWWTVYFSTLYWQAGMERWPEGRPFCLSGCLRAWKV